MYPATKDRRLPSNKVTRETGTPAVPKPGRNKPFSDFSSSFIKQIDYVKSRKVLKVWFTNGNIYEYSNVSIEMFNQLKEAPSKGTFFWKNIRNEKQKYPSKKIKSIPVKFNIRPDEKEELLDYLEYLMGNGQTIIRFPKWYDINQDEFYYSDAWDDPERRRMRIIHLKDILPTQMGVYIQNLINILNDRRSGDPAEEIIEIGINEDGIYSLHGHHRLWIMKQVGISAAPLMSIDITENA